MIKACIFDFDGLILETELPVYQAWQQCYEHHGHELDIKEYANCVGSDENAFDPVAELERRYTGEIDWQFWNAKRVESIRDCLQGRQPLPGIKKCLSEADDLGMPCAVASSSPRHWVDQHLEKLSLRKHFHSTHCLEDVQKPKPSPELFLLAAKALDVEPSEAVVFEDSLNGLNAAVQAGMSCVVIPGPVTRHLEFSCAAIQLGSMEEMNLSEIIAAL